MTDALATNLQDAAYEGVTFPVAESSVDGGHDSVEHTAYGRRGADVEPTGLNAYRGSLVIPLYNDLGRYNGGNLYPGLYGQLKDKFETTPIGNLLHPSLGTLTAHIKSWSESWDPDRRNGLAITAHWIEHNATVGILLADDGSTPLDSPSTATSQAAAADSAVSALGGTSSSGYVSMAATIASMLAFLEGVQRTAIQILATINSAVATCSANIAVTALAGVPAHQAVAQLEQLRGTIYRLRDRYLPDFARFRTFTVTTPMSVPELAQFLYGNASLASLLSAANAISDPLLVPAGTVLTILPDS